MWFHFPGSGCSVPHCIVLFGEMPFRQDTLLYKHAHTQTFRHTSNGRGRKRCCLWWINSRLAGKRPAKKIKPACVSACVCVHIHMTLILHVRVAQWSFTKARLLRKHSGSENVTQQFQKCSLQEARTIYSEITEIHGRCRSLELWDRNITEVDSINRSHHQTAADKVFLCEGGY